MKERARDLAVKVLNGIRELVDKAIVVARGNVCPACGEKWQGPHGPDDAVCGACFMAMNDCGGCETCDRIFGSARERVRP